MKILVVDDEPEILKVVSQWLSKKGYDVITTGDVRRALDLATAADFDLVLLDLIMPQSTGLNTITKIHERKPKLPIVIMSVIEDTRVAVLAVQEGVEGYITKPIEFDKLEEMLNRLEEKLGL